MTQRAGRTERPDISPAGRFMNAISQMSDEERAEMWTFGEEMRNAVQTATFDAAEMAANAPDALKSFAEENGIDLEQMLEEQASMLEKGRGGPPPPPPMMYGEDGTGITSSSEGLTAELLQQFLSEETSEQISWVGMTQP